MAVLMVATTTGLATKKTPIVDHEDLETTFIDGDLKDYDHNCMCGYRSEFASFLKTRI